MIALHGSPLILTQFKYHDCSLAYLHHLAKAREPLLASLLAIHNVHHMNSECSSCALLLQIAGVLSFAA